MLIIYACNLGSKNEKKVVQFIHYCWGVKTCWQQILSPYGENIGELYRVFERGIMRAITFNPNSSIHLLYEIFADDQCQSSTTARFTG